MFEGECYQDDEKMNREGTKGRRRESVEQLVCQENAERW